MIRTLKSIEPLQLGKMLGAIYGLLSLFFLPFFFIFAVMASVAPKSGGDPSTIVILLIGLAFAVFFPLMYAVMGFVLGVVGGWVYNLVAKWLGGLEFEIE
jgi:hypothetical protein